MNIALITSTISPTSGVFALKVTDPSQRLNDYKTAFRFYCNALKSGTFDYIVYVDNSGYDLSSLTGIADELGVLDRIEFISYVSDVEVESNSRFFLEIHLIDYSLKNSHLINTHSEAMIWKITGRYLILNIESILSKWKDYYNLYINHRDYPKKVVVFYLIGFSRQAYDILFKNKKTLYQGKKDGELILREYLDNLDNSAGLRIQHRFASIPRISGVRGFDGAKYGGVKDSIKYYIRSSLNKLIPFFRIWSEFISGLCAISTLASINCQICYDLIEYTQGEITHLLQEHLSV